MTRKQSANRAFEHHFKANCGDEALRLVARKFWMLGRRQLRRELLDRQVDGENRLDQAIKSIVHGHRPNQVTTTPGTTP